MPLGFLVAALFFLAAEPRGWMLAVGGVVSVCGLLVRAWAAGHIRKNAELATTGPYAFTRNPLYLGSFLIGLGFTVAAGRPLFLGLVFASLFLGIYLQVMRVEAATLGGLFGDSYRRYAEAVPLFFPRLTPYRDETAKRARFDAALYMRYREYQAALGLVIAWTALALRDYWVHALKTVLANFSR